MKDIFSILLVDDNPADVRLTLEALAHSKLLHEINVVEDGLEAMAFLRNEPPFDTAPRPDLILLDLNMPKKDGRQVLAEIKSDPALLRIPVVILTTSQAEKDVLETYDLHANGYIVKPVDIEQFFEIIKKVELFWVSVVMLPPKNYK
jgi:two-component system, chemotaxis family, response regulator Rcp1